MTDHETLIALWAGKPEADLRADIAEIITRVGADDPGALAEEIAYVVMQHGMPAAAPTVGDLGATLDADGWIPEPELQRLAADGAIREARWANGERTERLNARTLHEADVLAEHRRGCPGCQLPHRWVTVDKAPGPKASPASAPSDLDAAIERIQTVRMLVDGQAKGSALTGDRDQFTHNWHVLEGIDLAMAAISSPHMKTVEEVEAGT